VSNDRDSVKILASEKESNVVYSANISTKEGSMYIDGSVNGVPTDILIDCGCEVTLVSTKVFDKIPVSNRPHIQNCNFQIELPGHIKKDVVGTAEVSLELNGREYRQKVAITDAIDIVFLGLDMMRKYDIYVRPSRDELYLGEKIVKVKCRKDLTYSCCRVKIREDVVVEACSRVVIPGIATKPLGDALWLTEPLNKPPGNQPLIVARTLVKGGSRHVPIEIMNPNEHDIVLYKDTHAALLQTVSLTDTDPIPVDTSDDTIKVSHTAQCQKSLPEVVLPQEIEKVYQEISIPLSEEERLKFRKMLYDRQNAFANEEHPLGKTNLVKHDIILTNPSPIKQPPRRVPFHLREETDKEIQSMIEKGVIEPSNSPWASPVVLVRKRDGSLRYCIDYRKVNEVTKKDSFPLPNIDDALNSLKGAQYFSSLDLCSGYWQVELTDRAKEISAFTTGRGGLWQFRVLPFGMTNAPSTFERLMERVLASLQWQIAICYLDDILVFSSTVSEHIDRLGLVLKRLEDARLRLKGKKCHLLQTKVSYLGHVVSGEGIATDPAKVKSVKEWQTPTSVHDVRCFMGLASYYRKFIPEFSEIVRPLSRLTEKNARFLWGQEQENAFCLLKERLISAPVLAYPDPDVPFILDTDASNFGMGAVLSQVQGGQERVISYASKSLSKAERRYCTTRKEMLAIVYFTKYFRHYLLGRRFILRSDHAALGFIQRSQVEGQMARWVEQLQNFSFDFQHRPGRLHSNADALSRRPCKQCGDDHDEGQELVGKPVVAVNQTCKMPLSTSNSSNSSGDIPKETGEDIEMPLSTSISSNSSSDIPKLTGEQVEVPPSTGKAQVALGDVPKESMVKGESQCYRVTRKNAVATPISLHSWVSGSPINIVKIQEEQLKDPAISEAIEWVKKGERPNKEQIASFGTEYKFLWAQFQVLQMSNGVLVREMKCTDKILRQVILPPSLREQALILCHDVLTSGHFGPHKTHEKLKQRFLWNGMKRDTEDYCLGCVQCAKRKNAGLKRRAPLQTYIVGSPMQKVSLDIAGPFPISKQGNKYILVVNDCYTRWVECYPLPSQDAQTVAHAFVHNFVSRFGVPVSVHSDQGRQFTSDLFKEMCDILGMKKTQTAPFHPAGNAVSERSIKTMMNLISTNCQNQDEWDKDLPMLTMAYRSTPHDSTGYSPNYAVFGREIVLPIDLQIGVSPTDEPQPVHTYVQELKERLQRCHLLVSQNLKKSAERQKVYYDMKQRGTRFQLGDAVYRMEKSKKKGLCPKLRDRWKGPYLITKTFGDVLYEVQIGSNKFTTLHSDLLKPCFSKCLPKWLKTARSRLTSN